MSPRVDFDWFDIPRSTKHRATDISRILDPSYTTTTPYSSSAAYLDRNGDLHDPDYRHFPIASHIRPRWETFSEDALDVDNDSQPNRDASFSSYQQHRLRHHHHHNQYYNSPPHSFSSEDDDTNVLDSAEHEFVPTSPSSCSSHGVSRIILRTKREFSKKRRSLDGYPSSPSSPLDSSLSSSFPSTSSPSTAPIKTDSDAASFHAPHFPLTQTLSLQSTSRSHRSPRASLDFASRARHNTHFQRDEEADEEEEEPTSPLYTNNNNNDEDATEVAYANTHADWTPTCSQALKRQWQALSLTVRLSVFRAQKRFKSRLTVV